jgi:hypothetical protein
MRRKILYREGTGNPDAAKLVTSSNRSCSTCPPTTRRACSSAVWNRQELKGERKPKVPGTGTSFARRCCRFWGGRFRFVRSSSLRQRLVPTHWRLSCKQLNHMSVAPHSSLKYRNIYTGRTRGTDIPERRPAGHPSHSLRACPGSGRHDGVRCRCSVGSHWPFSQCLLQRHPEFSLRCKLAPATEPILRSCPASADPPGA